jgi:RimJ/RimL family protein N-acetyltransferase
MSVAFFLRDGAPDDGPALPDGMSLKLWRPNEQVLPPLYAVRAAYWLQAQLGMFADRRFTELSLWSGEAMVHRLIVTPRWYRFPFMAAGDLQFGALWTHPAHRRRGLARLGLAEAHRLFSGPTQRFWYVADSDNLPSTALAIASGYRLTGIGRRTTRFGLGLLGQFQMDRPAADRALGSIHSVA